MVTEPRLPDAVAVLQIEPEMSHQTCGGWGAMDNPTLAALAIVGFEEERVTFQRERPYLAVGATTALNKRSRHLSNHLAVLTKLASSLPSHIDSE